jgi:hypothetical protein
VSVWYPAFGLGQLFTNDSNKDEDVLQLEFVKEEPDLIDLYESDDYSQRAREHVRKIKKENTEVIDISDDSNSQVPASLALSRTSGQSGSRSSFSSHSSLPDFKPRDHDPKRRKYIVDSDEDEDDAVMMSMPQKRKRKAPSQSSAYSSSFPISDLDRAEAKRRKTNPKGKGTTVRVRRER